MKYYSNNQVIQEYDSGLQKIISQLPEQQSIFIHGFGELGKSGSTMLYFLRQTPAFKSNEHRITILKHVAKLKSQGLREGSVLVLLDDIIGTGRSLSRWFAANISHQLLREKYDLRLFVLCVAFMKSSISVLKRTVPGSQLIGTGYNNAFASSGSVFGYRPRMIPVREFCYRYGIKLFTTFDQERKEYIPHPLGYNNAQALIVFAHSVPNNTLPIIWSLKSNWHPLYPRSGNAKVSESRDFRNDNFYWLNLAYQLKILKPEQSGSGLYTHNLDYGLIAIMRLKRQRAEHSRIFQILGISVSELEQIFKIGREKGFFDESDELTEVGNQVYQHLSEKIKFENSQMKRKRITFNQPKIYVPKQFKAMT